MKTYFLPIKSVNLAHYFQMACIAPVRYIKNRNNDIQSLYENVLLLSSNKYTTDTNCAIEIVINEKVEKIKPFSNNFFICEFPLPISRVKNVYFQDEKQIINTAFNINSGAGFVPKSILKLDHNSNIIGIDELNKNQKTPRGKDWSQTIDNYDKVLGGFALLKIAGADYQNYPANYFNALGLFNTIIRDELTHQKINVSMNYDWAFIDSNNKFKELKETIYSTINNTTVEQFARKNNIPIKKRNGLFLLEEIDHTTQTYLVAILGSYGEGTRKKIDEFIADFISNKFQQKRKEGIALIFGINKGYQAFRNSYKIGNMAKVVKYKLESQLDYYTIESIYQFVFNGKTNNSQFSYIDSWCPKIKEDFNYKEYQTYNVLDETIIYQVKQVSERLDSSIGLIKEVSPEKIYRKLYFEFSKLSSSFFKHKTEKEAILLIEKILGPELKQFASEIHNKVIENKENIIDSAIKTKTEIVKQGGSLETKNLFGAVNESQTYNATVLENMNLKELKSIAKSMKIKNYSKIKASEKHKLIKLILDKS